MLNLRTLLYGPAHERQIGKHIQETTNEFLSMQHGSLYPALHRPEERGPVTSRWERISHRTCPGCGHVSKKTRKTQAQFACVESGFSENADLVGAINVRRAGHAQITCQVNPERGGQQQEPLPSRHSRDGRKLLPFRRGGCSITSDGGLACEARVTVRLRYSQFRQT